MSSEPRPNRSSFRMGLMFLAAGVLTVTALLVGDRPQETVTVKQDPVVTKQQERPQIEVVFALDTTGSMAGLIEGAKEKIWSVASEIARGQPTPILKVGLVAYRDTTDDYVTKVFPLTTDLDSIYVNLRSLDANGGGDLPEHVGRALGEAVSQMPWSQDRKVMKMIYVVGDAPPQNHNDGFDAATWAKRAHEQGIMVNTIRCGELQETQAAFTQLAQLGSGSFFSIGQNGGWVATATPYDGELKKLNEEIANKTLYGGRKPAREAARAKAQAMGKMSASSAADRMSYFQRNASGGLASTAAPAADPGAVDYTMAPAQAAAANDDELPEELRGLDKAQRQAKAEQMADERKALEKKVMKIAQERDAWLSKNSEDKKDAFDTNVKESVKAQAEAYGIKY